MKYGLSMVFLVAMLLLACGTSRATDIPILRRHVNDYAQVLGARAETMEAKLVAQERATGHQVVVLTVPDLGGQDIESYANDAFAQWKLGRKGMDDGVLIVVAVKDRRMRIEVGYGLEGDLTDLASAQIIRDRMRPRFAAGDYAGGVEAGIDGVLGVLNRDEPAVSPVANETPEQVIAREGFWRSGAGFFVVIAGVFCVLFGWLASQGGGWWSLFLLGPITVFMLRFVWPWSVVGAIYVLYVALEIWLRRRRMHVEFRLGHRNGHHKSTVTSWPPTWWQVIDWSGPMSGGVVARSGNSGSGSSSGSSSGYSGGGGSSGGGGASGSW